MSADRLLDPLLSIAVGIVAVLFRTRLGRSAIDWNYRLLGVKFDLRYYQIGFLLGGSGLIVIGVLALFGVIQL